MGAEEANHDNQIRFYIAFASHSPTIAASSGPILVNQSLRFDTPSPPLLWQKLQHIPYNPAYHAHKYRFYQKALPQHRRNAFCNNLFHYHFILNITFLVLPSNGKCRQSPSRLYSPSPAKHRQRWHYGDRYGNKR